MRKPIWIATGLGAAFALLTLALLVAAALEQDEYVCEVCVTFLDRTICREAAGPTPEEATRTAQDNACAFLASGMTQVVSCGKTRPDSVSCSRPGS